MQIILTICSKEKTQSTELQPAILRYLSKRISDVQVIAEREKVPFYIFSGKFGVIRADTPIPYYEKQVQLEDIPALSDLLIRQFETERIDAITFYAKDRHADGWEPYYQALEKACEKAHIVLHVIAF
jgi:hypothetical protein